MPAGIVTAGVPMRAPSAATTMSKTATALRSRKRIIVIAGFCGRIRTAALDEEQECRIRTKGEVTSRV
jgi:hypothetical protein